MSNLKKQRTFADGKQLVADLNRSGLTHAKFAKKAEVPISVLQYWVTRIRKAAQAESKEAVRFLTVVPPNAPANFDTKPVTGSLELPGGVVLKMERLPSPEYLGELYVELQRRQPC